jgi:hypothetical protein
MLVEPYLDTAALVAALRRDYGLAASAVRFIPVGETAWCYQVTDEQGGRWFLKLGRPDATEPARADFALRLGRALADLGLPVPRPQVAQGGALWSWLRGLRLALFEFVDGEPLSDQDLSAAGLTDLVASLTAAIHGATRALPAPVPLHRDLRGLGRRTAPLPGQAGAERPPGRRIGCRGAGARVAPEGAACKSRCRRSGTPPARSRGSWCCAMATCAGTTCWSTAPAGCGRSTGTALCERDLALFASRGFERFLAGYERAVGHGIDLDVDLLAFFLLRRNADDLVDWLEGVLTSDRPIEQRRADLDGVAWCLSRRTALETRIQHTREVLARRHGRGRRP